MRMRMRMRMYRVTNAGIVI